MRRIACLVGLALGASLLVASPVGAAAHPTLRLTVPAHAHANKAAAVTYHSSATGSEHLVIQRLAGSDWQTLKKLGSPNGSVTLPALPIGVYDLRLAAYTTTASWSVPPDTSCRCSAGSSSLSCSAIPPTPTARRPRTSTTSSTSTTPAGPTPRSS